MADELVTVVGSKVSTMGALVRLKEMILVFLASDAPMYSVVNQNVWSFVGSMHILA